MGRVNLASNFFFLFSHNHGCFLSLPKYFRFQTSHLMFLTKVTQKVMFCRNMFSLHVSMLNVGNRWNDIHVGDNCVVKIMYFRQNYNRLLISAITGKHVSNKDKNWKRYKSNVRSLNYSHKSQNYFWWVGIIFFNISFMVRIISDDTPHNHYYFWPVSRTSYQLELINILYQSQWLHYNTLSINSTVPYFY